MKGAKMFRARDKVTKNIVQVLDTMIDEIYGVTFFLIWENNGWRWRPAKNYIPPNYALEE